MIGSPETSASCARRAPARVVIAGHGGDAGRVRPAAIGQVGPAGALTRHTGGDQLRLGVVQLSLGERDEAAQVLDVVAAQRIGLDVDAERLDLGQRAVGALGAGRGDLAPRADQQQLDARVEIAATGGEPSPAA